MNDELISAFRGNERASKESILLVEDHLEWSAPQDFKTFLLRMNGGEGFIGDTYLMIWRADELAEFNRDYEVEANCPGLVLFGSDGGGEAFGFQTDREDRVVRVPFIGMSPEHICPVATSFDEFLQRIFSDTGDEE